jgi:hypothetical protein
MLDLLQFTLRYGSDVEVMKEINKASAEAVALLEWVDPRVPPAANERPRLIVHVDLEGKGKEM